MFKLLKRIILLAIVAYGALCAMIYFKPELFFYNPTHKESLLSNATANGYKAKAVEYKSADGTALFAWLNKPAKGKKIIVFMHGNSYNIEKFYHKMLPFQEAGYGTMLPEYRGFGNVQGQISQKNLSADAIAAIKYLNIQGYQNKDIILYGMSLGSYMATNTAYELGQKRPFAALILEVPFDSLFNTVKAKTYGALPLNYLMTDKYDSYALIDKIKSPILVMGGSNDPTIPVSLAEKLYQHAANPKKMIIYQGGAHNDLYNFRNYRDILKWLKVNEKTRH